MKGFKTVLFGSIIALLGGFESAGFTDFIAQHAGSYSSAVGIAIVLLRTLTTTSIFTKD